MADEFFDPEGEEQVELPSFGVDLFDEADSGANFNYQNDPNDPLQRNTIIEDLGLVKIQCTVRDIVHGMYGDDEGGEATLVVLLFRFSPSNDHRRIKQADIKITFVGASPDRSDPEVAAIYPVGLFGLYPTTRTETVCNKMGVGLKGGAPPAGEVSADLSHETTTERKLESMGSVFGMSHTEGRRFGRSNAASWTLNENADVKPPSGVAASMQCAILLRRRDAGQPFAATVEVEATADRRTAVHQWLQRLYKKPGRVDSLLFDPTLKPTNRLRRYDEATRGALGSLELDDSALTDITVRTIWDSAVKHTRTAAKDP